MKYTSRLLPSSVVRHICAFAPLLSACLHMFCATQMPPSGGPPDEDPPKIVTVSPTNESVRIARTTRIKFAFSEWIEPRSAAKSVVIFPPVSDGIKVSVAGKKMDVLLKSDLAESTTYHVELNSTLKDLHGNSLATPYHLVFSTGDKLDSSKVWGCIADPKQAKAQPKVALFRLDSTVSDTQLLSLPSYLAQTDTFGRFELKNIRSGTYNILAFLDSDNNNRLTSGKDQAFAPVGMRFELVDEKGPVVLYPTACDSSTKKIAALKPVSASLMIGQWDAGAHTGDSAAQSTLWQILSVDTSDTSGRPPEIESYIPIARSMRFALKLDTAFQLQSYLFIYTPQIRLFVPDSVDSFAKDVRDTIRFNGTITEDTVLPSILSASPRGSATLTPRIAIAWSEPVRAARTEFFLADTLGDTVTITADTLYADTTVFALPGRLNPDRYFTLFVDDSNFMDLSGNFYTDTSDTPQPVISIKTIAGDSLCMSLSGYSECLESSANRFWRFLPLGSKVFYQCKDNNSQFKFDSIPAAKGQIAYFIDNDGNEEITKATLFPWQSPEPYFVSPDTVEARARWDIEGISFTACEACPEEKPPQPAAAPDSSSDISEQEKIAK